MKNTDVLHLFEKHVDNIKSSGTNQWVGNCPFPNHPDRKASFCFNSEHGLYNCKGCGEEGNAIKFAKAMGENPEPFYSDDYQATKVIGGKTYYHALKETKKEVKVDKLLKIMNDKFVKKLPKELDNRIHSVNGVGMDDGCLTYPYFDADGNIDGIKRHKPKAKSWGNMKKRWYGIWHIGHASRETLIITEGEKDVCTLKEAQFGAVVSGSGGSNTIPPIPPVFKEFKEIIILYDNDEAGRKGAVKMADTIYKSLGVLPHIAEWWYGLPKGFDCSDDYEQNPKLEETYSAIGNAKRYDPMKSNIPLSSELNGNNLKTINEGMKPMSYKEFMSESWHVEVPIVDNIVTENSLTTIGGDSGIGKSWLGMNLAMCISSGKKFLDHFPTKERRVLLAQFELTNGQVMKRLDILKPKYFMQRELIQKNLEILPKAESFQDQWKPLYDLLDNGSYKNGVVIVDNLYTSVGVDVDTSKNQDLIPVINKIDEIMMKYKVAVVLITHHKKGTKEAPIQMDDILGGATITRWSSNIFQMKNSQVDNDLRVGKITKIRDEVCELYDKPFKIRFEEGYFIKGEIIDKEVAHYVEPSERWERKLIEDMRHYGEFSKKDKWDRDWLWSFLSDHQKWDKTPSNEKKVSRFLNRVIAWGFVEKLTHNTYTLVEIDA